MLLYLTKNLSIVDNLRVTRYYRRYFFIYSKTKENTTNLKIVISVQRSGKQEVLNVLNVYRHKIFCLWILNQFGFNLSIIFLGNLRNVCLNHLLSFEVTNYPFLSVIDTIDDSNAWKYIQSLVIKGKYRITINRNVLINIHEKIYLSQLTSWVKSG
jgi:hypothetical protein